MGGTSGHVSLGFAFLIIGLWHLFNCTKFHALSPRSYTTLPWFPISRFRYLEPIAIMLTTLIFILSELFLGHRPLSPDGTIPFKDLRHFEHSMMALSFFVCSFFAALFDKISPPCQHGLVFFLQAVAFGQELLILHLHSTDHMGVEGQYHWLLQIITFVSIVTTFLAIGYPGNFLNAFIRGFSVIFQGVWLIVTGFMLWTPEWIPKGCFLKSETGRNALLCHGERALDRAKALVNIEFGLYLTVLTTLSMCFYLVMIKLCHDEKVAYEKVPKVCEEQEEGDYDQGDKHKIHKVKICA